MQEILSTLAVVAVLAVIVGLIVRSMLIKKRRGGGCGCSGCANAGLCHGHGEHKK